MLQFKTHPLLVRYVRVGAIAILAVVFGWSGLHKVIDPSGFSLAVFRYHLLPYEVVNIVSLWITWLELACAFILLCIPRFRLAALWLILGLLLVFSLGIGINLMRGSHMACGCFSSSPMAHYTGWFGVLKNLGLIIVATYVLAIRPSSLGR
ncbi:MAG: hypothetical protein DRP64_01705 [Verrucomicrobia bacterium]|nr:MAG: hypothetical protein DRP64_01705 [Verrucomicrobiota bacterium]